MTSPVELRGQLEALLLELAAGCATSAGVARKLLHAGCRGRRRSFGCCPVASWINSRLGVEPGVSRTAARLFLPDVATAIAVVALPDVIQQFVGDFDSRETFYPQLIAES